MMKTAVMIVALLPLLAMASRQLQMQAANVTPTKFKLYTAYPQPLNVKKSYTNREFGCVGEFALCAYATCTPIPNSKPPTAECGCYAFNGTNLGTANAILNKKIKKKTLKGCKGDTCLLEKNWNKADFCKSMNKGKMYKGTAYNDYISTYNTQFWNEATNTSHLGYTTCPYGGNVAICYTAGCRKGAPSSPYLPVGAPAYNATCYCPIYTTTESFAIAGANQTCGSNTTWPKEGAILINGA